MQAKTRVVYKELEHEANRMAACLCAAVDAVSQAEKHSKQDPRRFSTDNICSIGLSLYIRRREREDASKPSYWPRKGNASAAATSSKRDGDTTHYTIDARGANDEADLEMRVQRALRRPLSD